MNNKPTYRGLVYTITSSVDLCMLGNQTEINSYDRIGYEVSGLGQLTS